MKWPMGLGGAGGPFGSDWGVWVGCKQTSARSVRAGGRPAKARAQAIILKIT